jgi:hypothetical protein
MLKTACALSDRRDLALALCSLLRLRRRAWHRKRHDDSGVGTVMVADS